jgi:hypothetical protein
MDTNTKVTKIEIRQVYYSQDQKEWTQIKKANEVRSPVERVMKLNYYTTENDVVLAIPSPQYNSFRFKYNHKEETHNLISENNKLFFKIQTGYKNTFIILFKGEIKSILKDDKIKVVTVDVLMG